MPATDILDPAAVPAQAQFNNSLEDDTDPITPEEAPAQPQAKSTNEPTTAILSARGAFYRVPLSDEAGTGFYAIEELRDYTTNRSQEWSQYGGASYTETAQNVDEISPILITGMELEHQDIVSRMACLDNIKVFYAFGQAFGQAAITGEILLGPLGEANKSTGPQRLIDFFWKYRVSEWKKPVTVSAGMKSYLIYLTGLRILAVQPEFHIMPWVLYGTLLDVTKEKLTTVINPKGEIFSAGGIANSSLFKALSVTAAEPPDAEAQSAGVLYPINTTNTVGASLQGKTISVPDQYRTLQPGNAQAATLNQQLSEQELTTAQKRIAYRDARLRELRASGDIQGAAEFEKATAVIYQQESDKLAADTADQFNLGYVPVSDSLTEAQQKDLDRMDQAIQRGEAKPATPATVMGAAMGPVHPSSVTSIPGYQTPTAINSSVKPRAPAATPAFPGRHNLGTKTSLPDARKVQATETHEALFAPTSSPFH